MEKIKEIANDPIQLQSSLKEEFDKLDTDKDGYISMEALIEAYFSQTAIFKMTKKQTELSNEEINNAIKIVDPDGKGTISYTNFEKFMILGIEKSKKMGI